MNIQGKFKKWVLSKYQVGCSVEIILYCMDGVSEYAIRKGLSTCSLWDYSNKKDFSLVYRRLLKEKVLRRKARITHEVFSVAGELYTQFLAEKAFAYSDVSEANVEEEEESVSVEEEEESVSEPMRTEDESIVSDENEAQVIDFNHPERYAWTKPLTCTINGHVIVPRKQNWAQLLVAILEQFIRDGNPNLESLYYKPLYGTKNFFLTQISGNGSYLTLSNEASIYVKFSSNIIIKIIGKLFLHCGINLNNVVVTYEKRGNASVQPVYTEPPRVRTVPPVPKKLAPSPAIIAQLTGMLSAHFSNGYRLSSPIEMKRFRSYAADDLGEELTLSDDELKRYIAACGTMHEGKVYVVSTEAKERIREVAEEYFASGAQTIFFAEFYHKNENRFFTAGVVSEEILIRLLRELFPNLLFTQTYFGYTDAPVRVIVESEILRVWGEEEVLLTYDQLAERLPYIPVKRIKSALGQNRDFIYNSAETFSHVSRIDITDEEKEAIREVAIRECDAHGYVSITGIPFGEIQERNHDLSIVAIHNAIYSKCLSDEFDQRSKIFMRKGDVFDALTIIKDYCRGIDKCSLDDLKNLEKELTGEVHSRASIGAGNTVLVRISKNTFVADRYVHFDVDLTDEAIESFVIGEYLPLKAFTTFGPFPGCGQPWNLFLLESYCRRFSRKFRLASPACNSRNTGAVVRKRCHMDYIDIMADAVVAANIPLDSASIGNFIFDKGYMAKRKTSKVDKILEKIKTMQLERD